MAAQRFPRMGSEMISPPRGVGLSISPSPSVAKPNELNKNESFLARLDHGGRGSMAAPTGATSGPNILTDIMSGVHTRKQSYPNFSSGMDGHSDS